MSVLCWCILISLFRANLGKYDRKKASYSFQYSQQYHTNKNLLNGNRGRYRDPEENHPSGLPWVCLVLGYCNAGYQHSPDNNNNRGLAVIYQWTQIEFDYPSELARQQAINSRKFVPSHVVPIDIDVLYKVQDRSVIFVSTPRFQDGVPATLGTVTDKRYNNGNPIIAPYPNWRWHQNPELCLPDRLVSVYRTQLDECGRLWVLDNGRLIDKQTCPPQIIAFDTTTNEVLHRYEIPESQLESTSLLVTPIVDVRDSQCRDTFVYIADCQVPALIVYDVKRNRSWKIIDKTMYPYPNFGTFNILGQEFDLMDGILGMDLTPYKPGQDRILFYHALTSGTENWVYTSHIRNHTLFEDNVEAPQIFHTYPGKRHSQTAAMAIDRNGIAYFGQASDTSVSCWNTDTLYGDENIDELSRNPITMQFLSGVKVVTNRRNSQELWFITMKLQKVYTGTLETTDTNFRIHAGSTDDLVRRSKCQTRQNFNNGLGSGSGNRPSYGGGYGFQRNGTKRQINDRIYYPNF